MPSEQYQDRLISHQIGIERLKTRQVRDLITVFNQAEGEYVDLLESGLRSIGTLNALNFRSKQSEINGLLRRLDGERRLLWSNLFDILEVRIRGISENEIEYNDNVFSALVPDITQTPPAGRIAAIILATPFLGRSLEQWLGDSRRSEARRLRALITQALVDGVSSGDIIARITGTIANRFADGSLQQARRNLTSIIRTAITHATTVAREGYWRSNSDIITGLKWTAVLDGRTTAICRTRDGRIAPLLGETNTLPRNIPRLTPSNARPPAHIGCRSIMVPIVNNVVPSEVAYETWLRRQPAADQDEILGRTKGRLFRRGELSLDRFSDDTGREYTIDQLRQRDQAAFERANL